MTMLSLLADTILLVHLLFVAIVVSGVPLILAGKCLAWPWISRPWPRIVHLAMILFVVAESFIGVSCPLTVWEDNLRDRLGQRRYGETGLVATYVHDILFYDFAPWVFTAIYVIFSLLVLSLFWLAPIKWTRKSENI
jgi:hypothetical protein